MSGSPPGGSPPGGSPPEEPWVALEALCRAEDRAGIVQLVQALPYAEVAHTLSLLEPDDRRTVLTALPPDKAGEILEQLSRVQASDLLEGLSAEAAAPIVDEMGSAEQADLLGDLSGPDAEAILREMDPGGARDARELLTYAPDTAGGLMKKEFVTFRDDALIDAVFEDLRRNGEKYSKYAIQYGYVVTETGALVGVLGLRALLFAQKTVPVSRVMIREPHFVGPDLSVSELAEFFAVHPYLGVPVTDPSMQILGVVDRAAVDEARGGELEDALLKVSGIVGGEEIRTMPVLVRSTRRLSWLSLNIVLNVISASVIAFYEDTLRSVIALAVFLPIISDMSGCSGNQAVTVSIRELTLGLVRPNEVRRVLQKEMLLGVLNGLVLGLFLGSLAFVWKRNLYLGIVVGGALMINTIVSVSLGGSLPLILKSLGRDPALASAPILTTITDLLGFLTALGFATILLTQLQG